MNKQCVLYDRPCIECGECDRCDLDPSKICDNCMRCVNGDEAYRAILIDAVQAPIQADHGPCCDCDGHDHAHHDHGHVH